MILTYSVTALYIQRRDLLDSREHISSRPCFPRKVVDVREVFHDAIVRHLDNGRVLSKEKLEEDKLKISARLVNFVVAGGVLLFRDTGGPGSPGGGSWESGDVLESDNLDEAALFRLLRRTILLMLRELNTPEVNLLKISLSDEFRDKLRGIFSTGSDPDRFPLKVVEDHHEGSGYYIGINMRNTRNLGEDIDRIERDSALLAEITGLQRPCRHTDGNLLKILGPGTKPVDPDEQDV